MGEKMDKVSVIIPVFNAEKTLGNTIKSIINQTYSELEVLLVNDGSTDSSLSVCRELQKSFSVIKIIDKKNGGVVSAYKEAIFAAQGRFVMFCDADDCYETDFVAEAVKRISENHCDFVSFGAKIISKNAESFVLNAAEEGFYDEWAIKEKILPHCLFNKFNPQEYYSVLVYRWNKIYSKELLLKFADKLDEKCFQIEDNVFTTLAILNSTSLYIDNRSFYNYYLQEKSITKGYEQTLFEKYLYSLSVLKKITEKNLSDYNPFQFELLAFENLRIAFRRSAKSAGFLENSKIIKKIRESGFIKNVRMRDIHLFKNFLFYVLYHCRMNFLLYLAFRYL